MPIFWVLLVSQKEITSHLMTNRVHEFLLWSPFFVHFSPLFCPSLRVYTYLYRINVVGRLFVTLSVSYQCHEPSKNGVHKHYCTMSNLWRDKYGLFRISVSGFPNLIRVYLINIGTYFKLYIPLCLYNPFIVPF